MSKTPLRIIPEPEDGVRPMFSADGDDTIVIHGPSRGHDYVCGACGARLISGMLPAEITNIVVRCAACGTFNETASDRD